MNICADLHTHSYNECARNKQSSLVTIVTIATNTCLPLSYISPSLTHQQ